MKIAQLDICPDLMGPSGITVPAYDRTLPQPKAMSVDDIKLWIESFVQAAIRVEKAGFDFVELHCAHGYGLNQFLSPITNQRDDQYGGSLILISISRPLGELFYVAQNNLLMTS